MVRMLDVGYFLLILLIKLKLTHIKVPLFYVLDTYLWVLKIVLGLSKQNHTPHGFWRSHKVYTICGLGVKHLETTCIILLKILYPTNTLKTGLLMWGLLRSIFVGPVNDVLSG